MKPTLTALLLALPLVLLPGLSAGGAHAMDSDLRTHVRFCGRWDLRDPSRAVTVNSGSHLLARFEGTSLVAHFDISRNDLPSPTVTWRVDDHPWQEAELGTSMTLVSGLGPGTHELMLMLRDADEHQARWSPPLTASLTFLGLEVPHGRLLSPPREPRVKIEFLGDSITEGVLVHSPRPGKQTWPWLGDGRLSYAGQTGFRLGEIAGTPYGWRQVGFGRLGLLIEGNGGVPPAADSFNSFYGGCPRDDWQPDLVVINQGTNDGGRSSADFRPAYRRYLEVIRAAYPKAWIAALRPFGGFHEADIATEVNARKSAGDDRVFYVDTTGWLVRADYTDGVHPNLQGSTKAADRLVEALRGRLGL